MPALTWSHELAGSPGAVPRPHRRQTSSVITMYLVEISYKELRGSLNVVTRFMFNFGNLLVMCVGPFLSYEVLSYSLLPLPVIYFLACWWIPESPYYYLKEGRVNAARIELAKLRNSDVNVITMYLVEISYKELRGSLNVVTRFMFNFGNLLVMCVGPFLSYEVLSYSLLPLPVIYFLACWWIPESPYYYLKEGRVNAARIELAKLRNSDVNALEEELQIMQSGVKNAMRSSSSAKELFTGKQYRKAVIIAAGMKMTQILTGGMAIQQYLIVIVQESKFKMAPATISIVFGAVKFGVSLISSVFVDRIGRRPLIIYTLLSTGISYAVIGGYFFLLDVVQIEHESLSPYGIITFIGILLSTIVSTLGFNSVIGIVPAEIFPLNVKAVAMTSLNILGGLLGFAVGKGYQVMKNLLGLTGVFWIIAFVTFSGAVFTYFFVPETRDKSLHDIQILLQGDLYIDDAKIDKDCLVETELTELNSVKDVKNTS
ncbi:Facilitated trehalose transporter Tret1 [Papilio xuthus]|uniref:Facilitated trehalose transporter Tret1 n=1 Tax=Papilio xuthus TaxID=66420 RepID=A0A194QAX5_PAPXU|nr:Facilitated trehalose transporter Tret1 [Papilio xuthus]